MAVSFKDQLEPIFWTSTLPNFNDEDRQRFIMKNGRKVIEKFPQVGHKGEYDDKKRAPGVRFAWMVRHDGFTAAICFTNGAAHMSADDGYGKFVKQKARFLGWYQPGQCPIAMVMTGDLTPDHIVDQELLGESPCNAGTYSHDRPCAHSLREKAARTKLHNELQAEKLASYATATDKTIEAQRENTATIIAANREDQKQLIKDLLGELVPAAKGKRKTEADE